MLIIKGALTAPSTHRLGSLQWGLRGAPGEVKGRHRNAIVGTHQVGGSLWNKVIQIPKRTVFPFYTPAGSSGLGLLEAKATALPEQLLLPSTWLDPDQRASGCSGPLSQLPHKSGGGGGGLLQAPHQHLSGIYRHTDHTQNPSSANQSGCFRNKLFFCFQNHPGAFSPTSLCRRPCPRYLRTFKAPPLTAVQAPAVTLRMGAGHTGATPSQSRLTTSFQTFAPDSQNSQPHPHSGLLEGAQRLWEIN